MQTLDRGMRGGVEDKLSPIFRKSTVGSPVVADDNTQPRRYPMVGNRDRSGYWGPEEWRPGVVSGTREQAEAEQLSRQLKRPDLEAGKGRIHPRWPSQALGQGTAAETCFAPTANTNAEPIFRGRVLGRVYVFPAEQMSRRNDN